MSNPIRDQLPPLNPQQQAAFDQLSDVVSDFEDQVMLMMQVYHLLDPRLDGMMLASLTDIVVAGLLERHGKAEALDMLRTRIAMAVHDLETPDEQQPPLE